MSHKEVNPKEQKERYLRRATRGLWGRKRLEVREELMNHIEGRTTAYRVAGMREGDALERTLQELGPAREVRTGMVKLYTLPTLLGSGALLAAACAAVVVLFSSSFAQTLQVTRTFPSPACLAAPQIEVTPWGDCQAFEAWTNVEALKEVFTPQGVEVNKKDNILSFRFTDGKFAAVALPSYPFADQEGNLLAEEFQPEPGYFTVWEIIETLARGSTLPLSFEGWDNPTVRFGGTSFRLGGDDETVVDGRNFYLSYLSSVAFDSDQLLARALLDRPFISYTDEDRDKPARLQVGIMEPGTVYGIVALTRFTMPRSNGRGETSGGVPTEPVLGLALDVAQADADGTVTFRLPRSENTPVTFVRELGGEPELGTAVLVRLTGEANGDGFGYEVVSPERIR